MSVKRSYFTKLAQSLGFLAHKKKINDVYFNMVRYALTGFIVFLIIAAITKIIPLLMTGILIILAGLTGRFLMRIQYFTQQLTNPLISLLKLKESLPSKYSSLLQQMERMYNQDEISASEVFEKKKLFDDLWAKEMLLSTFEVYPASESTVFSSKEIAEARTKVQVEIDRIYRSLIVWSITRKA